MVVVLVHVEGVDFTFWALFRSRQTIENIPLSAEEGGGAEISAAQFLDGFDGMAVASWQEAKQAGVFLTKLREAGQ